MKRLSHRIITVGKAIFIAFFTVIYSILSLFAIIIKNNRMYFALARSWSKVLLFFAGIKVKIEGKENIRKGISYIFISNHASHFDIPVLLSSLSDMLALVYKRELKKIPIFGFALGLSPHISIDRSHPKKAIESINTAVEKLETGSSVLVFPEGTRSLDGTMSEFKRGAFMIASRSGKPIIPVSVTGTFNILPRNEFNIRSGKVTVKIHKVIDNYEINSPADEKLLMNEIKEIIKKDANQ